MNTSSFLRSVFAGLALVALTSFMTPSDAQAEPLYFALEVRREGRLVAQPKLLGETGRTLRAERRQPGALHSDYQLILTPMPEGKSYRLALDLTLPELRGHSELALLHGQQRKLQLGNFPGELEVSLLLMKVDSPEFRALMNLSETEATTSARPI
ncbi:hypothetical protein POL68_35775 [Stigmatella sp. ncwal1]|uniref:Uncharacterized protein n=1 Tax=Stigmatella ashevillensis TaxID=2995309 RepID=A0ABT5DJP6_9BACT|nr:hypothetical protein [Stigmatella ashevillena]MDC0713880.1 hypothetical protein [Stigmatella ashevillena]